MPDSGAVNSELSDWGDGLKVVRVQVNKRSRIYNRQQQAKAIHSHLLPGVGIKIRMFFFLIEYIKIRITSVGGSVI